MVRYRLNNFPAAQDLYARAYDIQVSMLGPDHQEVATTMNNTAGLLRGMGKLTDAEVVYRTVSARSPHTPCLGPVLTACLFRHVLQDRGCYKCAGVCAASKNIGLVVSELVEGV